MKTIWFPWFSVLRSSLCEIRTPAWKGVWWCPLAARQLGHLWRQLLGNFSVYFLEISVLRLPVSTEINSGETVFCKEIIHFICVLQFFFFCIEVYQVAYE